MDATFHAPELIVEALQRAGYAVLRREHGWHECLLVRGSERWFGSGDAPTAALQHALALALPSELARRAFAFELAAHVAPDEPEVAPASRELFAKEAALPLYVAEAAAPAVVEPEVTREQLATMPAEFVPKNGARLATDHEAVAAARDASAVAPEPSLSSLEAFEALDSIEQDLSETLADVAFWTPERQRLVILGWISAARSLQARSTEYGVSSRVARIAGRLSGLSRTWWPGSVRALQQTALPSECCDELGLERAPRTWTEVADAAAQRLAYVCDEDLLAGRGEHGWSDDAALSPSPPEPETVLASAIQVVEQYGGPLEQFPSPEFEPQSLDESGALELARAAERLRWLRGATHDGERWGAALGRLRWIASRVRSAEGLQRAIDPRFRPERNWEVRLGSDLRRKEQIKRKSKLLKALPPPGASREQVMHWLLEALDCPAIEIGRFATGLEPHRETLGSFRPEELSRLERADRRRLRLIGELLFRTPASVAAADEAPTESDAGVVEPPAAGESVLPLDVRLHAEVLPRVRNKQALLVTNRSDPELQENLREMFEFASVDHCDTSPARVDSAALRIRRGSYDFVLAATGFLPHKVDAKLRKACTAADMSYVRINRARPQGCLRGLARELGILQRHGHVN